MNLIDVFEGIIGIESFTRTGTLISAKEQKIERTKKVRMATIVDAEPQPIAHSLNSKIISDLANAVPPILGDSSPPVAEMVIQEPTKSELKPIEQPQENLAEPQPIAQITDLANAILLTSGDSNEIGIQEPKEPEINHREQSQENLRETSIDDTLPYIWTHFSKKNSYRNIGHVVKSSEMRSPFFLSSHRNKKEHLTVPTHPSSLEAELEEIHNLQALVEELAKDPGPTRVTVDAKDLGLPIAINDHEEPAKNPGSMTDQKTTLFQSISSKIQTWWISAQKTLKSMWISLFGVSKKINNKPTLSASAGQNIDIRNTNTTNIRKPNPDVWNTAANKLSTRIGQIINKLATSLDITEDEAYKYLTGESIHPATQALENTLQLKQTVKEQVENVTAQVVKIAENIKPGLSEDLEKGFSFLSELTSAAGKQMDSAIATVKTFAEDMQPGLIQDVERHLQRATGTVKSLLAELPPTEPLPFIQESKEMIGKIDVVKQMELIQEGKELYQQFSRILKRMG
jgi:hypothetical protein